LPWLPWLWRLRWRLLRFLGRLPPLLSGRLSAYANKR
jgi:hypothetical protein